MTNFAITLVSSSPSASDGVAELFEKAGIGVAQLNPLDLSVGRFNPDQVDLLVVVAGDLSTDNIDLCRRLRDLTDQPILLLLPAFDEDTFVGAYEVGVDECISDRISSELLSAKARAWIRWTRRGKTTKRTRAYKSRSVAAHAKH